MKDDAVIKYGLITVGAIILLPKLGAAIQQAGAGVGGGIADIGTGIGLSARRSGAGIGEGAGGVLAGLGRGMGAGVGEFYAGVGAGLGRGFKEFGGGVGEGIFDVRRGIGLVDHTERWDDDTVIIHEPVRQISPQRTQVIDDRIQKASQIAFESSPIHDIARLVGDERVQRAAQAAFESSPIHDVARVGKEIWRISPADEIIEAAHQKSKKVWDWVF